MTLREAVKLADDPLEKAFVIAAFLRSAAQGEPSTFDGECASILKAQELGIEVTTEEGIAEWLDELCKLADMDIPGCWWMAMFAED